MGRLKASFLAGVQDSSWHLVFAEVLSSTNLTLSGDPTLGVAPSSYLQLVVKHDSLQDLTDKVSADGHASVQLSFKSRLFAFYQYQTHHQALAVSSNATGTIFDNGSYTVDHYSARGANTVTRFWEEYILTSEDQGAAYRSRELR